MKSVLHDKPLVDRRLLSSDLARKFLRYDPVAKEAIAECCRDVLNHNNWDRIRLSRRLCEYNEDIGNDPSSLKNCERLRKENATVVVTGQQAGILTGPLYTIYKIITAVNLARKCEDDLGTPVIPVFWNATEDHDLDEISVVRFPERRWKAKFSSNQTAVEHLPQSPECAAVVREYLDGITPVNHRDEIGELLEIAQDRYCLFSSALIARLFAGTGLVVVEPRLFRDGNTEFFAACISQRGEILERLSRAGLSLQQSEVDPTFYSLDGLTGLFYINQDGVRRRIIDKGNRLIIDGNPQDESTVLKLVKDHPERFSTSAFLRPVFQSINLPNIAYVAGPSEYRYHLQLRPLYELLNAVMPVIRVRNHATIVTAKEQKLAAKLGFEAQDYFRGSAHFYNQKKLPDAHERKLDLAESRIDDLSTELLGSLSDLLSAAEAKSFSDNLRQHLSKLRKKLRKNYAIQEKTDNARIDRFFRTVFPGNEMQERVVNVFYFLELCGLEFISQLIEIMDPFETKHYIIYTTE